MNALALDFRRAVADASGPRWRRIAACVRSPGVHAVAVYRFGRWALAQPAWARVVLDPLYGLLDVAVRVAWGIEISRRADIGPGLYIAHAGGIVVAPGVRIGENCNLSHQVTIGLSGRGERRGVPSIGHDCYLAPGAKVIRRIAVGDNVKIGANAVVHRDIPDNAVVALDPGYQIVSFEGNGRGAERQRTS